jgi:hypothetical protein
MTMRSLRRLLLVAVAGALLVPAFASVASAGGPALSCSYSVTPNTIGPGGSVTVSGTAPGNSIVEIFGNTTTKLGQTTSGPTGIFSVAVTIPQSLGSPVTITIGAVGYGTLPCPGIGDTTVVISAGALAFTGSSSHTTSIVLISLGALAVGTMLVIGARRRRTVEGRV